MTDDIATCELAKLFDTTLKTIAALAAKGINRACQRNHLARSSRALHRQLQIG
jgi:hypothetical protein